MVKHLVRLVIFICNRFTHTVKVRWGISNWIHKFSEAAVTTLKAEYEIQQLETIEDKVAFVGLLLGDVDDMQSKIQPFLRASFA